MLSIWLQIFIAVVSTVFAAIMIVLLKSFIKEWREMNRRREIHYIKIDCIVAGLKQMNGNTSLKFSQVFDDEFEARTKEFDLITK